LRISRHHGNVKSSVLTQDFVIGADYATPPKRCCVPCLIGSQSHARRRRPAQGRKDQRLPQAMRWLIGQAENGSAPALQRAG
jgi:DNA gyrase subunit B